MANELKFIYSSQKLELQNTALFTQRTNVTWVPGSAPGAALWHSSLAPLPGTWEQRAGPSVGLHGTSAGTVGEPWAATGLSFALDAAHWDGLFGQ